MEPYELGTPEAQHCEVHPEGHRGQGGEEGGAQQGGVPGQGDGEFEDQSEGGDIVDETDQ